jgi:predicted oxidoreductase
MRTISIPRTPLTFSRIAYGCMNIGGGWDTSPADAAVRRTAAAAVRAALDQGVTLFDHADIYCAGKSEALFGDLLRSEPGLRDKMVLQSKCGIRRSGDPGPADPGRYDFSAEHIMQSVEGSLRRLGTGTIDILLLHRPDPLVEPDEVARAFDDLHAAGKVRWFGVSNHTPAQIDLLLGSLDQPIIINQVEISLLHHYLVSEGIIANMNEPGSPRAAGTLDYCRSRNILIQAWAPLAGGRILDPPPGAEEHLRAAADLIASMAAARAVPREAVALAWLLRHPAPLQPIIGTVRPDRIAACCAADAVELTREEWYALLVAARGKRVP